MGSGWRFGVLAAFLVVGCSRSGLFSYAATSAGGSGNAGGGGSGGGSGGASGGSGGSGGVSPEDICPSSVSGPKAMLENCSTRDGRSRVPAPVHPHVTWSKKLPTDSSGQVGTSAIATDGTGHAYVVTTGEMDESAAAMRRVRTDSGAVDWSVPISPDQETGMPLVLQSGSIDLFGYAPGYSDALFQFDVTTGGESSTTFGFDLYYAGGQPAVGADGSLYITHSDNVGTANTKTFISRVSPTGSVLWTSVNLGSISPQPADGDVYPSIIALGKNGRVVTAVDIIGQTVIEAFDAATGMLRWSTPIQHQTVGGPAIRPDGSIALIQSDLGKPYLLIVDPTTGTATRTLLAHGATEIFAVTRSGNLLVGANDGNGITGIAAISGGGTELWTHPGLDKATLASNGSVVCAGKDLAAIDEATGKTKWQLSPPHPGSCIVDFALTSNSRIVGLQCDGTLFGASD